MLVYGPRNPQNKFPNFSTSGSSENGHALFFKRRKSNFLNLVIDYAYGVPKEAYWFTDFRKHNFDTIYRTRRALLEFFAKNADFLFLPE